MQRSRHPNDTELHNERNFACISAAPCNTKTPYTMQVNALRISGRQMGSADIPEPLEPGSRRGQYSRLLDDPSYRQHSASLWFLAGLSKRPEGGGAVRLDVPDITAIGDGKLTLIPL